MSNNHTKFLPKLMTFYFSLTKSLLSTRATKKFMLDVLYDQYLVKSHFHCLTETELQWHDDLDQIKSIFNGQFKIEFNINEDKCKNIMIRYKDNISIINHVKWNGISVIQFQKVTFGNQPINHSVVYPSPSSFQVNFVNYIIDIVEEYYIEVLLGDLNNFFFLSEFSFRTIHE